MQHNIRLTDPWFEYVKTGQKIYEGRRFLNFDIGDILRISHRTNPELEPFRVKIKNVLRFKTFEEALNVLNMSEVLPGVQTVQEGVEIYYQFVSLKTQEAEGICMIEMSPME